MNSTTNNYNDVGNTYNDNNDDRELRRFLFARSSVQPGGPASPGVSGASGGGAETLPTPGAPA